MASGTPNPTPIAIVCDLFLLLDEIRDVGADDECDSGKFVAVLVVEDEMMDVREDDVGFEIDAVMEEFEDDGKAGMTTWFSLTGSVVNLSCPVQQ